MTTPLTPDQRRRVTQFIFTLIDQQLPAGVVANTVASGYLATQALTSSGTAWNLAQELTDLLLDGEV